LTINAFIAALFACTRVYQKLINKYEHRPTPSQPKNIVIKLSPVTKINIKNVNKDKYDINRETCGSCAIYCVEYKCTSAEILFTTINMLIVILSTKNPQSILKIPELIQGITLIVKSKPVVLNFLNIRNE